MTKYLKHRECSYKRQRQKIKIACQRFDFYLRSARNFYGENSSDILFKFKSSDTNSAYFKEHLYGKFHSEIDNVFFNGKHTVPSSKCIADDVVMSFVAKRIRHS